MKNILRTGLALCLAILMLLAAIPAHAATVSAAAKFSDVAYGAWYTTYLDKVLQLPGVINGYPDGSFRPNDNVTRGEFLKMVICASQLIASIYSMDRSRDSIHWAGKYYTIAKEDNLIVSDVYSGGIMFECTAEELNKPITRYEMATVISNITTNTLMEQTVVVENAFSHILDYDAIPDAYITKVEQAYGKGILTGFEDTSFRGEENLTRAEAVTVIERLLWDGDRKMPEWAHMPEKVDAIASGRYLDPTLSFANWLKDGHVNAYGKIDDEAKVKLFGTAAIDHFSSAEEAAPYMTTVTVPIWKVVDKTGNKVASTTVITVNTAVAEEVKSIFQMIYDDSERFPIYAGWSVGGARYTDKMRHSWGCAIDINAFYNCECNVKSGPLTITCGYGWWPIGHADSFFAGELEEPSIYSIGAQEGEYGYSVVKAFATYGWGWGGNGWSGNTSYDYMHFSVLPTGG